MTTAKPSLVEQPTKFGTSLQTLSGEPLDWTTLHAMNEAWHRMHDVLSPVLSNMPSPTSGSRPLGVGTQSSREGSS